MARFRATIEERGNGFAGVGEYVVENGVPYVIVDDLGGRIHTGGPGVPNYYHALVEEADWSGISEDAEPYCTAVVDTDEEEAP